jgi:hypothetical protein
MSRCAMPPNNSPRLWETASACEAQEGNHSRNLHRSRNPQAFEVFGRRPSYFLCIFNELQYMQKARYAGQFATLTVRFSRCESTTPRIRKGASPGPGVTAPPLPTGCEPTNVAEGPRGARAGGAPQPSWWIPLSPASAKNKLRGNDARHGSTVICIYGNTKDDLHSPR